MAASGGGEDDVGELDRGPRRAHEARQRVHGGLVDRRPESHGLPPRPTAAPGRRAPERPCSRAGRARPLPPAATARACPRVPASCRARRTTTHRPATRRSRSATSMTSLPSIVKCGGVLPICPSRPTNPRADQCSDACAACVSAARKGQRPGRTGTGRRDPKPSGNPEWRFQHRRLGCSSRHRDFWCPAAPGP